MSLAGLLLLVGVSCRAGEVVAPIVAFNAPLSPPPVVVQLRLDLAALSMPTSLALPPAAASLTPAAWSNLRLALDAAPAAVAASVPAAAAAVPASLAPHPAVPAAASADADALSRLQVAQQTLGRFDPAEFSKLSEGDRDAALNELWDGWRKRGLVADPVPGGEAMRRLDRGILEGVDDKALTHANKSIFLGVGVLGYPLDDALWLARTRIGDALDENNLQYPAGQRWRNDSGTPEFLGVGPHAQGLVDAWGAATEAARQIVRQVELGSHELPDNPAVTRPAAAAFARVVAELLAAGDREAVATLTGQDPTFTAFLLDARKPGYYLYNGDKSAVARIMRTRAVAEMGIRGVEHADASLGMAHSATYLYRPARVIERLREVASQPAPEHGEAERQALAAYAEKLAPLAASAPAGVERVAPYTFAAPEFLPGSVLQSKANAASRSVKPGSRYDLPFSLATLRPRLKSGERYGQFSAEQWTAFELLMKSCPALASAPDAVEIRFVSESFQSRGLKVAPLGAGKTGAVLQLSVLDEVSRLRASDPAGLARELRFLSAAFTAALR